MNDRENKEIKNPILFENESYNKSLAEKNTIIAEKDETIKILTNQLGERDQVITQKDREIAIEKTGRMNAESKIAEGKNLEVGVGKIYAPRTKEEKFLDSYREACERLRKK